MTSFSPAYNDAAAFARHRDARIEQVRLVAQWATDLPGQILFVDTTLLDRASVLLNYVDPSDVTAKYGPPQDVSRNDGSETWRWLHPEGFELRLNVPREAA